MCCSSINNYLCAASLNLRVQKKWRGHYQESTDADLLLFHFRVSVLHFRRLPGDAVAHLQSGSHPFPDPDAQPTSQNPAASYHGVAIISRIKLNTHTRKRPRPALVAGSLFHAKGKPPVARLGTPSLFPTTPGFSSHICAVHGFAPFFRGKRTCSFSAVPYVKLLLDRVRRFKC
jgi:hypothetical protein